MCQVFLWNTTISGLLLHVKIVYLPTRCPELNQIEFMFHLLSNRIQSFWYRIVGVIDFQVIALIGKVLDGIEYEMIINTHGPRLIIKCHHLNVDGVVGVKMLLYFSLS
jgi:hypothetical protein